MNNTSLKNRKVAILVADGFEESEFTEPRKALENANASVDVVSINKDKVKSWRKGNWGKEFDVDRHIDDVSASDYDALLLPGGVINPDKLRREAQATAFVRDFFEQSKPVAAICHGPWMLAEADVLRGRKITSFKSIRKDMENAGAEWVDEEVVVDEGLVTSRNPDDLPAFCDKMIEEFAEGKHEGQMAGDGQMVR